MGNHLFPEMLVSTAGIHTDRANRSRFYEQGGTVYCKLILAIWS